MRTVADLGFGALALVLVACGPRAGGGDDDGDDDGTTIDAGDADRPELQENAAVFAHTASELYRVSPDTFAVALVAPFTGDALGDDMTDIAIDSDGQMIGISYTRVYRIDSQSAVTQRAGTGTLPQMFNGLSFVPSILAFGVEGPDVLIASRNADGKIFRIDPATGQQTEIGDMGGGYQSSGDIVAVRDFGIVATTGATLGPDTLVRLAPTTFAATPSGTNTGWADLWGVGFWRGKVYGFSEGGAFVTVDTTTGVATLVENSNRAWWACSRQFRARALMGWLGPTATKICAAYLRCQRHAIWGWRRRRISSTTTATTPFTTVCGGRWSCWRWAIRA
jgi:hypothetical protein